MENQIIPNKNIPSINIPTKINENENNFYINKENEEKDFQKEKLLKKNKKISLGTGYSQMDWMRLQTTSEDLSGTKGKIFRIPMKEVKKHNKEEDAWLVLRGKVYNITPYFRFHPGGKEQLMKGIGKDATLLFEKKHPWVNAEVILQKCFIGYLVPD